MRVCSVPGCPNDYRARGYCVSHYNEKRKTGELELADLSHETKLFSKIEVTGFCWLWTAHRNKLGYGTFKYGKGGTLAHRAVYETLIGPVPDGLVLDHLCRIPACVNPDHLEPVTNQENCIRGHKARKTGYCPQGHSVSGDNIFIERRKHGIDAVRCKTCRYDQLRRSAAKRKEKSDLTKPVPE